MEITVFTKKLFVLPLVAILLVGCSAAQWFKVIGSLLPLAAQVATQFYAFSNKGTVDADDQKLIQEYTANAQNLLATISNAVKAITDPADISDIQKVDALLKQLQTDSNVLLASLHVKDANTVAFVNALLADAVDLAGLVPVVTPSPGPITQTKTRAAVITQVRMSTVRGSALKPIFEARLKGLPQ
jgi:hypothetical protein